MSAKQDKERGLQATVYATREQVVEACTRAVDFLGKHASVTASSAKLTVKIYPGPVQKLSSISPTVNVSLRPGDDGAILVNARIEHYRTVQSRFLLIPMGPKRLVGKGSYVNFLKSLSQELSAIDAGRGRVQLTGVSQ
jgi:hypothetical protein